MCFDVGYTTSWEPKSVGTQRRPGTLVAWPDWDAEPYHTDKVQIRSQGLPHSAHGCRRGGTSVGEFWLILPGLPSLLPPAVVVSYSDDGPGGWSKHHLRGTSRTTNTTRVEPYLLIL